MSSLKRTSKEIRMQITSYQWRIRSIGWPRLSFKSLTRFPLFVNATKRRIFFSGAIRGESILKMSSLL